MSLEGTEEWWAGLKLQHAGYNLRIGRESPQCVGYSLIISHGNPQCAGYYLGIEWWSPRVAGYNFGFHWYSPPGAGYNLRIRWYSPPGAGCNLRIRWYSPRVADDWWLLIGLTIQKLQNGWFFPPSGKNCKFIKILIGDFWFLQVKLHEYIRFCAKIFG